MALKKYTGSQFLFNNPAYKPFCEADEDFIPKLDIINIVAKKYGIQIYTTSSFRLDSTHIKGVIVTPASKSNHFVAHAIDANLLYKGKIYNSSLLANPVGDILAFIKECKAQGIRWGGDFHTKDPVHFDDGLNIKNPTLWEKKFKELHP